MCVCVRSCGVECRKLWTHIWLRGLSQGLGPARAEWSFSENRPQWDDGEAEQGGSKVTRASFAYFLQKFALHSQFPRGHLLRLLALGFAGGVRVGNVDPELAFLLRHREEQADMSGFPELVIIYTMFLCYDSDSSLSMYYFPLQAVESTLPQPDCISVGFAGNDASVKSRLYIIISYQPQQSFIKLLLMQTEHFLLLSNIEQFL